MQLALILSLSLSTLSSPAGTPRKIPSDLVSVDCPGYTAIENYAVPDDWESTESPCPFLNSLRNTGILPPTGEDYSPELLSCSLQAAGIGKRLADTLVTGAFKGLGVEKMDLVDLRNHEFIEHDGSLTRFDLHMFGDAWSPVPNKVETQLLPTLDIPWD